MRSYFILIFLAFLSFHSFAQDQVKSYVEKNIKSIKSIQPDYNDYSDLEEISKAIGDARVVMLGEQDHGDGATFLAKTRLVKFLHEKKGFNVLAFEGDFFALNQGYEFTIKENVQIKNFLNLNTYPVWSKCKECDNLFYNYIPDTYKTNNPLKIAGFDNQMYGAYSWYALKTFINEYLIKNKIAFTQSTNYKNFFIPFLDTLRAPQYFIKSTKYLISKKHEKLKRFEATIDTIVNQLQHINQQEYEILVLKNLKELAKENYYASEDVVAGNNTRDAQMAKNLEWLIRYKYPLDKVIVWAANAHISKGTRDAYQYGDKQINWMGSIFTQDSLNAKQTYVIGFASKTGTYRRAGAPKAIKVLIPKKDSFERWIDDNMLYAFIDFKTFRNLNPAYSKYFQMKGIGHYSQPALWTNIYDGIFYIRDMTPCSDSEFKITKTQK